MTTATVCSNAFSAAGDSTTTVPAVRLSHPSGAELVVALRGAAVLAWRAPWRGPDGVERVEDLVDGYADEAEVAAHDAARSALMAPFVNRLAGGEYVFDGVRHLVPPVLPWEPLAMHGFARTLDWTVVDRDEDPARLTDVDPARPESVTLRASVAPDAHVGYPFALALEVEYVLDAGSLGVTLRARNVGATAAPVALGWHPYLRVPGHDTIDRLELTVPAGHAVLTGAGLLPLAGAEAFGAIDGVGPLPLAGVRLDHAFGDLGADADGRARTLVRDPATGQGLAVWQDRGLVHVYTGDGLVRRERAALAVEPVETLTDAFNRPDCAADVRLEPGAVREFAFGAEILA
ncbi:aldose 1-epimerase [Cellulosimicrobium protaetiae]|uniref:Aldose 1-epimerase n=1 Tax=Cellulosimicrobium protaetiae TaxID=2587808 RepID=A0A6M5UJZ3_9MICO|nr:aldose 1-epimerase [Cellulosimicrobium protaetiae]QJW37428.1 aldose 1-epimerase [Cellulosimicrobium protaetiae]